MKKIKDILELLGFIEISDSKIRKKYIKDQKNSDIEIWQWRDYTKKYLLILPYYYEDLQELFGNATNFIAEVSKDITIDKFKNFGKDLKNG